MYIFRQKLWLRAGLIIPQIRQPIHLVIIDLCLFDSLPKHIHFNASKTTCSETFSLLAGLAGGATNIKVQSNAEDVYSFTEL